MTHGTAERPLARTDKLVVEPFDDETLVYDLTSHKAHCLNHASALIWRQCDGRQSVEAIAARLSEECPIHAREIAVRMALDQLANADLLTRWAVLERSESPSRRDVIRTAGLVAGASLVPIIETIMAPLAAQAASSTTIGDCQSCVGINLRCSDAPGTCRQVAPGSCDCV
jgi:hypothetical protein